MSGGLKKKAQSEALGLAVVVILIIIGITLMIILGSGKKASKEQENYIEKLSSNTLYAMLNMDADECRVDSFQDVIKDCINQNNFVMCTTIDQTYTSCEYMDIVINQTLFKTIADQFDYYMEVSSIAMKKKYCNYETTLENCQDKKRPFKRKKFSLPAGYGYSDDILLKIYLP